MVGQQGFVDELANNQENQIKHTPEDHSQGNP